MSQEIKVPEVAEGVKEGTVISLSVAVGDRVEYDQTLLELETDKAVVAIPSPSAGTIKEIRIAEGDQAAVGETIMVLSEEGEEEQPEEEQPEEEQPEEEQPEEEQPEEEQPEEEQPEEEQPEEEQPEEEQPEEEQPEEEQPEEEQPEEEQPEEEQPEEEQPEEEQPEEEQPEEEQPEEKQPEEKQPEEKQPEEKQPEEQPAARDKDDVDLTSVRRDDQVAPAAPSVRRLARELGVDIYQVQGSGPGGRISDEDVRLFVRDTMQKVTAGSLSVQAPGEFPGLHAQRPLPDFSKWGEVKTEKLSRIRELTADAMSYAWSTIPMVTQYDQAQVAHLEEFRRAHNAQAENQAKVTMTAILAKICATALKVFPQFNSSLDLANKQLILKQYAHIGVAVDTPNGLLVPVLREVGEKGIEQLAAELNDLAQRSRERKIKPDELEGGCFTISNLGGIGGTAFTPLVYAPQVAILGVSRAEVQPIWNGSEFVPQLVMPLSLSYDHRVVDGADGARFLRWICRALEQPIELVMKG